MKVPAFIVSAAIAAIAFAVAVVPAVRVRTPVLLELFTSEGCSSCPPADQLLEKLDIEQPVSGADLIVLSEHVDYGNHLGWSDPYSLPLFSARQQAYDRRLSKSEVYTPQVVIDGRAEALGSDRAAVLKAVTDSLTRPKIALAISATKLSSGVMLHVSAAEPVRSADKAVLSVILAMDGARSSVTKGENRGRSLNHVSVAYSVLRAGEFSGSSRIASDLQATPRPGATRAIALLQTRSGDVIGVSEIRF
jgi:hypothetical protein